jgi:uncharacterized protein YbaR (Trm112 family)
MTDRDREPMLVRVCPECKHATFYVRQPKRGRSLEIVCVGCGQVYAVWEDRD